MKKFISLLLVMAMITVMIPLTVAQAETSDAEFDIVLSATDEHLGIGSEIELYAAIKNITHEAGIVYVNFELKYDTEKVTLTNNVNLDNSLDCIYSLPCNNWENVTLSFPEKGLIVVSALNAETPDAAKNDGDLTFVFRFEVISDAEEIEFDVDRSTIEAADWNDRNLNGNGSTDVTKKHYHSFVDYVSDGNATCTADGTKTAKCVGCDLTDTVADTGSAKGHEFKNYVSDGNATCTEDGTKTAKCVRCDVTDTVADEGSAKGHSFINYVSDGNATCTEDGTETAKCEDCDATHTRSEVGSRKEHTPAEWIIVTEPDYGVEGLKEQHCADCDELLASETIPALVLYILGDVNGDEKVNSRDYGLLKRHCLGTYVLDEIGILAGDINGDEKINARDYGLLKRHCLGTYNIYEQ